MTPTPINNLFADGQAKADLVSSRVGQIVVRDSRTDRRSRPASHTRPGPGRHRPITQVSLHHAQVLPSLRE
jgi:hypothetical protein